MADERTGRPVNPARSSRERLAGLATRVRKERGYSDEQQRSGHGVFVCPRANMYGGREGIIPPAVAVQRGLVPAGLSESTNEAIMARHEKRVAEGKTESEYYLDYYGEKADEQDRLERQERQEQALSGQARREQPAQEHAALQVAQRRHEDEAATSLSAGTGFTPVPNVAENSEKRAETGKQRGQGVFFSLSTQGSAPESLDDFYDALPPAVTRGATVGVGRGAVRRDARNDAGIGSLDMPHPAYRPVFPAPANETFRRQDDGGSAMLAEALSSSEAERARLAGEVGRMQAELAGARLESARLSSRVEELERQAREVESRTVPEQESHEDVSVTLGAVDERLKVGGDGWECNVLGHVESGRDEVVLVVPDPRYGGELLARARPGRMAVLSASGRTDCEYFGCCGRIYGEAGDRDYIALLRARRA